MKVDVAEYRKKVNQVSARWSKQLTRQTEIAKKALKAKNRMDLKDFKPSLLPQPCGVGGIEGSPSRGVCSRDQHDR